MADGGPRRRQGACMQLAKHGKVSIDFITETCFCMDLWCHYPAASARETGHVCFMKDSYDTCQG